ncbi:ABC transporter substrate-binding protein [Bosea sp. BH3]|uniref:ABC transporter substrate-binding protein n=1 Tax=Bosea sp. BH3 TaxID=2871701 RepID=UPI0021CB5489|nr:ABC transporter substrate-binding protein [Bosea sp. BH3]MCU4181836.1 ABC transporter substrate-binding protein [Bosea sp. BH3]
MLTGLAASAAATLRSGGIAAKVSGGTLQAAIWPAPSTFLTAVDVNSSVTLVAPNIIEGLLAYGDGMELRPSLAEHWAASPDGLSITFKLRPNVRWHDGKPFTSRDVKYSLLEVWKKIHPRGRSVFAVVDAVETPDDHTAIFKLSRPSLVVSHALTAVEAPVLPAHLYEGKDVLTNPHNLQPVGTGAFRFRQLRQGEFLELERNSDYWDEGRPYLDRIVFRFLPDAATRSAALEAGEVQFAPWSPVPIADVARLKDNASLIVERRGYQWEAAYFRAEFNLRNPILADVRVRRAFAHAINREGLADTVWYGLVKPATGPVVSTSQRYYTADVPRYAFDPAAAKSLLDEAGHKAGASGQRFSLNLLFQPLNDNFRVTAEYIKQNLRAVGIDAKIVATDMAGYIRRVFAEYDFDVNIGQMANFLDPEIGMPRQFLSNAATKGIPWVNASGYGNPEVDALIQAARVEPDEARRADLFKQLQRRIQTDLPVLPLFELGHFSVHGKAVTGFNTSPDGVTTSLKNVRFST